MSNYYFDASALVKRYVDEEGSIWVRQVTNAQAQNSIMVAEITLAEVAAAFAAQGRAPKGTTEQQRDRAVSRFLQDCHEHFLLLPIDRLIIDRAVELTQKYRLRGYDAVQLAAALVTNGTLIAHGLSSLVFVAADKDLLKAASAENLPVENPLQQ